ncbi:MAG: hypothetical protein Q7T11_01865 [Deltaproteobacteria bacterium]|nr:hypothetical protein [Deltaproteobacteria bacterium]
MRLKKVSQIVALDPDIRVADFERELNAEGLTGGYLPAAGVNTRLSDCLARRVPNLFFMKYGGIENLCVGGTVITPGGREFVIKTAPRAAVGPDFRRIAIGSDGRLGKFKEVALRVFPSAEAELWGIILLERVSKALEGLRRMLGCQILPLFGRFLEDDEAAGLLRSLNLQESDKTIFAFKLSGPKSMVEAEKEAVTRIFEEQRGLSYWPSKEAEKEILDETLINAEGFSAFIARAGALV